MDKLSDAEEHLRAEAIQTIANLKQQLQDNKIDSTKMITELQETERIHRLQADQASSPIYAEALMQASCQHQTKEQVINQFKILFKSRAQSTHAQLLSSEVVSTHVSQNETILKDIDFIKQLTDLLKGSIATEHIYLKLQIINIQNYIQCNKTSEAALIAEQLQSDTAVQVDYKTRLHYIYQQIKTVNLMNNQIRSLLIFQKFNEIQNDLEIRKLIQEIYEYNEKLQKEQKKDAQDEQLVKTYNQKINDFNDSLNDILKSRSLIFKEEAGVYNLLLNYEKYAYCLFKAAVKPHYSFYFEDIQRNDGKQQQLKHKLNYEIQDDQLLNKALFMGFLCQDQKLMKQIMEIQQQFKQDQYCLIQQIIVNKQIQDIQQIDTLQNQLFFDEQLLQLKKQFTSGFVKYQFQKIKQVFSQLTFQRIEELLGVQIQVLEEILFEIDSTNILIDRLAGIIYIQEEVEHQGDNHIEQRVMQILQGVADIGYMIYAK